MNSDFRRDIRIGMIRYREMGIVCRPMTPEELKHHNESLPDILDPLRKKTVPQQQLPFKERVRQVRQVRKLSRQKNLLLREACEQVGITYDNFKSINAALKKGKTKRS